MDEFEDLLKELEALQKAQSQGESVAGQDDQAAVEAAAGTGADANTDADADADADGSADTGTGTGDQAAVEAAADAGDEQLLNLDENANAGKEGAAAMTKSFAMPDGSTLEVKDAEPMLKAVNEKIDAVSAKVAADFGSIGQLVKAQTALIKHLTERVDALSKSGRGRRSAVVSVVGQTSAAAQTELNGVEYSDVMAKCLEGQQAGKLTGLDVAKAEACLNRGMDLPQKILSAIG